MKTKQKTIVILVLLVAITISAITTASAQQKVNIKTLFWMLPDDVFPEYVPLDDKKGKESHINECDYKNGYLSFGGSQYTWEMCYWNLKDGRKLVAVNNHTEDGSVIRTFFYEKGKLREDKNYKLGGEQTYKLEDFIDVSQLKPDELNKVRKEFNKGNYTFYYNLPQKGTSLIVSLNEYSLLESYDVIPYEAQKQVTIKWINEKWVKQ